MSKRSVKLKASQLCDQLPTEMKRNTFQRYLKVYFCNTLQSDSIFTALHVMQTRYSEENSVRPSVRLSVTRVIPDKTEERSIQIFIPYERIFILVF